MVRGLKGAMRFLAAIFMAGMSLAAAPANAADGCAVMVCMAGNWRNIAFCVPPVREALHDVAKGRSWPECKSANTSVSTTKGNTTSTATPLSAPGNCPRQYATEYRLETGSWWVCRWSTVIELTIDGQPWSNTYADSEGNTVTQYFAAARAQLSADQIDSTYDNDLAAFVAAEEAAAAAAAAAAYSGS